MIALPGGCAAVGKMVMSVFLIVVRSNLLLEHCTQPCLNVLKVMLSLVPQQHTSNTKLAAG